MKNQKNVITWFQQKIFETYGKIETKTTLLPPKIEWEEVEVPYEDSEDFTELVEEGTQDWVHTLFFGLIIIGIIFFFINSPNVFGVLIIFSGIIFYIYAKNKYKNTREVIKQRKVSKTRIEKIKKEIPQSKVETVNGEWSIKRMGTGYLDFAILDVNGNRFLSGINLSNSTDSFQYPYIESEKEFTDDFLKLEKELEKIPYVLNGEKESFYIVDNEKKDLDVQLTGLEKIIMNHFINTEITFMNLKSRKVSPMFFKETELKPYLIKSKNSNNQIPRIIENDLINTITAGIEFDDICRHWLNNWPNWIKTLHHSRVNSIREDLIPEFTQFSNQTHYSSFNFYCPECNKEIEDELLARDYSVHSNEDLIPQRFSVNTRCHYLLELNAWKCPMCENVTLSPISLHKILDDIFFPVYDSLMVENKNEREKNYSKVRIKEMDYKNEMKKELEKMYFDNLNSILDLKDSMEQMNAEIDGESEAIHFINDSIIKYKKLQSDIINNIEISNKEMKMNINATAQKILSNVDRVKIRENEFLNKELNFLSAAKRLDTERRDFIQREILSANKESIKEQLDSNKRIENYAATANAMQACVLKNMGANPYDDNNILRPARALNRLFVDLNSKVTGTSTIESNKKKLQTLNK